MTFTYSWEGSRSNESSYSPRLFVTNLSICESLGYCMSSLWSCESWFEIAGSSRVGFAGGGFLGSYISLLRSFDGVSWSVGGSAYNSLSFFSITFIGTSAFFYFSNLLSSSLTRILSLKRSTCAMQNGFLIKQKAHPRINSMTRHVMTVWDHVLHVSTWSNVYIMPKRLWVKSGWVYSSAQSLNIFTLVFS